jgi:hypothetical protein
VSTYPEAVIYANTNGTLSMISSRRSQRLPNLTTKPLLVGCLLVFCVGCMHRPPAIVAAYRVESNAGYPLLVPSFASTHNQGDFQTSNLVLGNGQKLTEQRKQTCVIEGDVFSLHPSSSEDSGHWNIRSWSLDGWNHLGSTIDVDEQWRLFLHALALRERAGCFAPIRSVLSLQQSIAKLIPLPTSEVESFLYSADAAGFVDLAPAMEIKLEEIISTDRGESSQSASARESIYAYYQVVASPDGVSLRKSSFGNGRRDTGGIERDLYPGLEANFAATPLIRLFFEQLSDNGTTRAAMLLGASNVDDLDIASERISKMGTEACTAPASDLVCVLFKNDSVSLFATLRLNGKSQDYPLGTNLGNILDWIPKSNQARALSSVRVTRRLGGTDYADVLFVRTMESARQIVLLPEDRIRWR